MILEVQHHAILFKKKLLLVSFSNNSLQKCRKPPNSYMFSAFHFDHGKYTVHSLLHCLFVPVYLHGNVK